jgi:hypothetical protein
MCKACFEKEYFGFPSEKDFEEFDLLLTKKLNESGLKYIGNKGRYLKFGYFIYKCENCNTTWWLSQPENAWRGFFAQEKNAKLFLNKLQNGDNKKKKGCFIILILSCLIILAIILKICA